MISLVMNRCFKHYLFMHSELLMMCAFMNACKHALSHSDFKVISAAIKQHKHAQTLQASMRSSPASGWAASGTSSASGTAPASASATGPFKGRYRIWQLFSIGRVVDSERVVVDSEGAELDESLSDESPPSCAGSSGSARRIRSWTIQDLAMRPFWRICRARFEDPRKAPLQCL